MEYSFVKMQGCGNDYVYVDCFSQTVDGPDSLAAKISDRHFGVGGDGLVLICPPDENGDAKMRMFNADGSEGNMCGNAVRCVGKYLYETRKLHKKTLLIETKSGVKTLTLKTRGSKVTELTVDMGKAILSPESIPVLLNGDNVIARPVVIGGTEYPITCVSMGNPHCVVFCDDPDSISLSTVGPMFENSPLFPERINTEFVAVTGVNTLKMRVWERGSGETLACGTGACAAAAASVLRGLCGSGDDIKILLRGGKLTVRCTDDAVYLTGAAEKVFEGTYTV